MSSMYHAGQRCLQDRFDTRRLADRLEQVKVHAELSDADIQIPKYQLVERSAFIPRTGHTPPVPDWKRADWARDVLPAGDPAQ
jgi:uncharacterized protein